MCTKISFEDISTILPNDPSDALSTITNLFLKVSQLELLTEEEILNSFDITYENKEQIEKIKLFMNSLIVSTDWRIINTIFDKFLSDLHMLVNLNEADRQILIQKLKILSFFSFDPKALLTFGGDDRLTINFQATPKLNKYLSSTIPLSGLVRRGSCTCSSVTQKGLEIVQSTYEYLLYSLLSPNNTPESMREYFDNENEKIRDELKNVFFSKFSEENPKRPEVILFPSGSDAEFLPLINGFIRSFNLSKQNSSLVKVYNYVTASGEVGSGTPNAANGRHFSPMSPASSSPNPLFPQDMIKQKVGDFLEGVSSSRVEMIEFKPRNAAGEIDFREKELVEDVRRRLSSPSDLSSSVAIIHVVCGAKTGLIYPSLLTVERLQNEFQDRILVVIDACQLRCRLDALNEYTAKNYISLITGSKFYTGPPFSGAVILPLAYVSEIESHLKSYPSEEENVFPKGIQKYISSYEIPTQMPMLKKYLQTVSTTEYMNVGLHLRWRAGLHVLREYHELPLPLVRSYTQWWVQKVSQLVLQHAPYLKLLEEKGIDGRNEEMIGNMNTIISIAMFPPVADSAAADAAGTLSLHNLNFDDCKLFHNYMASDMSKYGPDCMKDVLSMPVALGQPVKLSAKGFTIVRIALGADMVVDAVKNLLTLQPELAYLPVDEGMNINHYWSLLSESLDGITNGSILETQHKEDRKIVSKMAFLTRNWHLISSSSTASSSSLNHKVPAQTSLLNSKFEALDDFLSQRILAAKNSPMLTTPRVSKALKALFPFRHKAIAPNVLMLYDLDALSTNINHLHKSFQLPNQSASFLHCFAIKSCPLSYILHQVISSQMGLETASIGEVKQALRCGCSSDRIVFDSPCKSLEEIIYALKRNVRINANSFQEIDRLRMGLQILQTQGITSTSAIGVRINPMVGMGSISLLSTATSSSKFGIPMYRNVKGEMVDETERIVKLFIENPFLSGVMCHVGSQGMAISTMVEGITRIVHIADRIDQSCSEEKDRIQFIDIGGGLSANYQSDETSPTMAEYVSQIAEKCPTLYSSKRLIITEFGKSIITKAGCLVARIEDTLERCEERVEEELVTAICHVGADLLLRTAYCPDRFPHRIALLNEQFDELSGERKEKECSMTVVGPLCFSGDIIASDIPSPKPQANDFCVILDAGANSISMHSKHCSRPSPAVYAFRTLSSKYEDSEGQGEGDTEVVIGAVVRDEEGIDDMLRFWD